jgi:hypothetical protein
MQAASPQMPHQRNFVDRDEEIKKLFDICMQNIVNLSPETNRSYKPAILVTMAQMFGSGKTTFAIEFLNEIKTPRFSSFLAEKSKIYGNLVQDFLKKAKLVYVDLRKYT